MASELTNKQLLELGWDKVRGWSQYHHIHEAVKDFGVLMKKLQTQYNSDRSKTQPTTDKIIIEFYDWYKTNAYGRDRHFAAEIRDHLFIILDIPEPLKRSRCERFWSTNEERYQPQSLEKAIDKLDDIIWNKKNPAPENIIGLRP